MKKIDNVQEVTDRWQYIMLAVAIFLAIIFCCYYIIRLLYCRRAGQAAGKCPGGG